MKGAVRRIGVEERRARLGLRHHLARDAGGKGPAEVARDLVALHSTDPASVFLAVAARMESAEIELIERALYQDRVLVRVLGMRRTVFVVPVDLVPIVQAACTRTIAVQERRRLVQQLEQGGIGEEPGSWLVQVEDSTLKALLARGEATATELSADEPRLRVQLLLAEGKRYEARQNIATRVLFLLSADGHIARGRPRGSWTSSQYRWSPTESWLGAGIRDMPIDEAQAELARRWLGAFGPGTSADLKWWTGWTAGETNRALAEVHAMEVDLDGIIGLVLPDDLEPVSGGDRWAALLPALDPTVMGWVGRAWFLGDHGPRLFDRSGNAGPTIWWDGRIVGGWAQRQDGEVALRIFDDVGSDAVAAIDAAAEKLRGWLGPIRVTPRFRTPLERELSG